MKLKRLLLLAFFTSLSLVLFTVEAQFSFPVPGMKLGLANVVTLFLLTQFSAKEGTAVLTIRILLGALLLGQGASLIYSAAGGASALIAMAGCVKLLKGRSVWFSSVMGGVFHNAGQLAAAYLLLGKTVLYYAPHLLVSGVLMGLLTGFVTQVLLTAWKYVEEGRGR